MSICSVKPCWYEHAGNLNFIVSCKWVLTRTKFLGIFLLSYPFEETETILCKYTVCYDRSAYLFKLVVPKVFWSHGLNEWYGMSLWARSSPVAQPGIHGAGPQSCMCWIGPWYCTLYCSSPPLRLGPTALAPVPHATRIHVHRTRKFDDKEEQWQH